MKKRVVKLALVMICLLSINWSKAQNSKSYVVVIGIDGLSSWGLKKYPHSTLDSLMSNGTYTLSAKAVTPTLSAPNWASILTGYTPKVHQIKSNHWKTDKDVYLEKPTLFQKISTYNSDITQAVFYQWKEFDQLIERDTNVVKYHCSNEKLTMDRASEMLIENNTQFTFIHIDNVDSSGHHFGQRSEQYKYAIARADSLIGKLIRNINQSKLKDSVYVLITSDHGFWGKHHGGITRRERNIPWIIIGPGIASGNEINSKVRTTDTSSLIYYLVSGNKEESLNEKLLKEMFVK